MTIFSNGHFFVVDFIFQSILKKALKVKELLNDQNLQGCLNLFIRLSLCLVSFSFWGCLNFAQWWMCGNGWGLRGEGDTLLNQIPVCVFEWKTCYPYYYQNTQQYILKYVWYSKWRMEYWICRLSLAFISNNIKLQ